MSFPRAKMQRFNEPIKNRPLSQPPAQLKSSGSLQQADKWQTQPRVTTRVSNRSFSQPASAVGSRDSLRACSVDDKKLILKAFKDEKTPIVECAETEFSPESRTLIELESPPEIEDEPPDTVIKKDASISNRKSSLSGIPILVKTSTSRCSTKPSPRPKLAITTLSTTPSTTPLTTPRGTYSRAPVSLTRRNLELQFLTKKKRLDQLKQELLDKQKPLMEVYQSLLQLKKKLEENGKSMSVDEIKIVDFGEEIEIQKPEAGKPDKSAGGEQAIKTKVQIDPELVLSMQNMVKQVPASLLDVCRNMMKKRVDILKILGSSAPMKRDERAKQIESLKDESVDLEKLLDDAVADQQMRAKELVQSWQSLLEKSGLPVCQYKPNEELQAIVKQQDRKIMELTLELEKGRVKSQMTAHDHFMKHEDTVRSLHDKIKDLKLQLSNETAMHAEHKEKGVSYEHKMKTVKTRLKDTECKNREADGKIYELQRAVRNAQDTLKQNEQRWEKEKQEMVKSHKQGQQILDKMTKDRTSYETRSKAINEMAEEANKKHAQDIRQMQEELNLSNAKVIDEQNLRDSLEKQIDALQDRIVRMELSSQQAVDLVNSRKEFCANEGENLSTQREAELFTELLSMKVALKSTEDKLSNYAKEKLRFIDIIERLNVNSESGKDSLGLLLIHKEEEITKYENKLQDFEMAQDKQKAELESALVTIKALESRLEIANVPDVDESDCDPHDLKMMLHQGKRKLDNALKKSLESDQQLIRYQHNTEQQSKHMVEMENLLKVRDGLIGMMKAKKDEITAENGALLRYSNEVRETLLETRLELKAKEIMVQELSQNLDYKGKVGDKMKKKIKELESSLSITNEKRYKLQDTVGNMEKELQMTKAHIHHMADLNSRTKFTYRR